VHCNVRRNIRAPDTYIAAIRSTEADMSGKIITATVAALLLASTALASTKPHATRHQNEQRPSYGEQGRYYDVVPGPDYVLPNFGPTSGEEVIPSARFPAPQGQGR
jgi:hypothetical protein